MKHLVLECGFEIDVEESTFEDMELFDAVADMEKGRVLALSEVTGKILGDRKAALYDFLRDENGRVPIQAVSDAVVEIFQKGASKNS